MTRRIAKEQVTLGLVQMSAGAHPAANLAKTIERIETAAKKGARIVCLQELFRSRYFCQSEDPSNFKLAESVPGPSTDALSAVAKERKIVIVASLFERRSAGIYHNTAVVIDADGSLAGTYRKMHIPDDPLYYEKFYFTPGDLGFPSFQTRYAKVAALVCWDQWFPEGARAASLSGAHSQRTPYRGTESTQRLGAHSAFPCGRQWSIRCIGQSCGTRRENQILGKFIRCRSVW